MYPSCPSLNKANFGSQTFIASAHPSESCGSNGLPLTPNSIRIYGRAQALYLLNHPHLCAYVNIHRGKHERILVVQESYLLNIRQACQQYPSLKTKQSIIRITYEIVQALVYLNNFGTVCRNLSPENIMITPDGEVKLFNYGLYYMTEAGTAVTFPIGKPGYLPKEVLIDCGALDSNTEKSLFGNPSWDVWSLGIILTEVLIGRDIIPRNDELAEIKFSLDLATNDDAFKFLDDLFDMKDNIKKIGDNFTDFLKQCLETDSSKRPTPVELLKHSLFEDLCPSAPTYPVLPQFPVIDHSLCVTNFSEYKKNIKLTKEDFQDALPDYPERSLKNTTWRFNEIDHLASMSMREVYYLWQLAGGNIEAELKTAKRIHAKPPILTLPNIMLIEGEVFGSSFTQEKLLQTPSYVLNLTTLRKRLEHIPCEKYYLLITQGENGADSLEMSDLPLVIRERDVEYQLHRLLIFRRLLQAYPYKLDSIVKEAKKDIPPFYRPLIWAALLHVDGNISEVYEEIDKETPTSTDRQIDVDIPRCHQYDELLSSPLGHIKFSRVLKAWVVGNPHLVYWQGLDSLCAPFLALNFNNEALAFACLTAFINKYLGKFFLQDNSAVIQEYLAKFSHMIAFHDPKLFNHLTEIGFIPDLYAIPWFLTMYTHVFPLHKIYLLWDTLLLGSSSLALCIGVALLRQLKDRLLSFGFNECILLFSDMPDIKMEQVVAESKEVFKSTPSSIAFREHDGMATPNNTQTNTNQQDNATDTDKLLMMEGLGVPLLKKEKCPRISGADVIELLARSRSKSSHTSIVVIDIRNAEKYSRGTITSAINVPADSLLSLSPDALKDSDVYKKIDQYRGRIIAVMGSMSTYNQVIQFAEFLLDLEFPRVCTLHRGIDAFRGSQNIFEGQTSLKNLSRD